MASIAEYERWLLENREFRDTPEFQQVAALYDAAMQGGDTSIEQRAAEYEPEYGLGSLLSRGVSRGFSRLGSTITDVIPALAGSALGFEDYAREQLAEAAAKEEELGFTNRARYQSFRDVEGIRDVPGFIVETLGEQAANILPSLAGGLGLGAVGARTAATAATRGIVEKELRDAALKQAAGQIARGRATGQLAGAAVGSYALNAPEIFQNIYEETGELAPGAAAAFSMAAAALDSILPAQLARSLTGPMKIGVAEALLARTGMDRGMLRKMAAGVLGGAATEAPTEAAQEAISIAAERFVAENPEAFTEREIERLKESFVRGAVAGGGLSAVGAVPEGVRESAAVAQEKAAAPVVEDDLGPPPAGTTPTPPPVAPTPTPTTAPAAPEAVVPEPTVRAQPAAPTPATPRAQEILRRMGYTEERGGLSQAQAEAVIEENDPEMLDYLDESVALPEEVVPTAPTQPAPKPAGPIPQEELDALKREVERSEAEGAAREATVDTTAQRVEETPKDVQEKLTQEPAPQTEPDTLIPADPTALKAWGRDNLGVGSSANLFKAGAPGFLGGKDLADPGQAAEVRATLEQYAKGRSPSIKAKVDEFLARPEFQAQPEEVVDELQAPDAQEAQPVEAEPQAEAAVAQAAPTQAEPQAEESVAEQQDFDGFLEAERAAVDELISREVQLTQAPVDEEGNRITEDAVEVSDQYRGTNTHNAFMLSRLLSAYNRQKQAAERAEPGKKRAAQAKLKPIAEELQKLKVDTKALDRLSPAQLEQGIAVANRNARNRLRLMQYGEDAQRYALENASNSPKLEGDLLDAVTTGNLKQTISLLLGKTTKRPEVQQILRKIQSLGLKTKIVVGAVPEGGLALNESWLAKDDSPDKIGRNRALRRIYRRLADIYDESFSPAEAYDATMQALPPPEQSLLRALDKDDMLGWDYPHQAIRAIIEEPEFYDISPQLKAAISRIGNKELYAPQRAGSYDPVTDTITLDPELGLNEHTLIHELSHAALASRIADPNSKVAKAFGEFFQIVKNQLGGTYGGTDVQEFAAELMGNEQFAASTKAMKAPKGGTLWDRIVQTLAEFFGFRKGQSVYDAGIKYINDLLNVPASAEPTLTEKLFMGTPNQAAQATAELFTAAKAAPKATMRDAQELVNRATKEGGAAHTAFGFLNLQNMHDMFATGDATDKAFAKIPKAVQRLVLQRLGFINNESARISEERAKFPVYETNTALMERTHDIMFKAREGGVDLAPGGEKKIKTAEQRALHKELSQQLNALPEAYRQMAYTMRRDYDNVYDAFQEAIISLFASDPKKAAEMKARFSTEMRIAGYIPSTRFGDLQVYFTDPVTGREAMESFEYISDKEAFIKAAGLKPGEYYEKRKDENLSRMGNRVPPSAFVKELTDALKAGGATDEMLGNVRELYLTMFPASSLAKNFIKSRNVPGMSKDMPRVHADFMLRATKQLADLKYAPAINDLMTQAESIAQDASNSPLLRAAARNLYEQRGFLNNPTYSGLVNGLSTASYVMNLVGNISAAAVNGSSLPLITFPLLSAKYRAGDVVKEMGAAMKLAAGKWGEGKYKALYDFVNAHGQLTHTMQRELVEASRTKSGDSKTLFAKLIHLGSIPFVFVEQYARAVTAITAYELALNTPDINGKKMSEERALEYALTTVIRSNTAGTAAASPRYMQTEWGRVILTFKSFNLNGSFVAARGLWEATKNENADVRRAAIRQSVAMFSAAGAFGGIMGLPFMGMAASFADIMAGLINMVDEDDEDYFSAQMFVRENAGRLLTYGPLDYFTGAAIGRRTVLTQDLVMRDDPKTVEEQGIVAALFKQMLGPMGGYAIDLPTALGNIKDGHYARGAEQLLPSAMRNVVKGFRYMSDGAVLTKNGDVITSDVTGFTVAKQILGFSPSNLADLYDRRNEAMQFTTQISERKQRLLAVIRAARRSGDLETSREAERKLQELGRKHPGLVNKDTVQRSIRASDAAMRDSITGLRFPTWAQPEVRRRFFQDEED